MKKTIKLIFLIIFIWVALSAFSIVNAASAEIVAKPTSVKVGEKATVTVTVNAVTCNLKVSGSATDKIVEYDKDGEKNITTTKAYTIDTSKAGTYTVYLKGDITDAETEKFTEINKSVSIEVKPEETSNGGSTGNQNSNSGSNNGTTNNSTGGTTNNNSGTTTEKPKTKSTNAYLSTLGVRISEADAKELGVGTDKYDFKGFKKTTLTYNVTVPYEVDSLKVSYKTVDSKATVKVTGNSGFDVGTGNTIKILVTAEDGKTTKTYTIRVTKLAEEEEKPGNIIEDPEGVYLTALSIKGIDISPEFSKDVYAYTAKIEDANITDVEVIAIANKENSSIEISGNTNLLVGENTINIVVKQENSDVQTVYQVTVTKVATNNSVIGAEENNFMSNIIGSLNKYVIIAIVVVLLMIIAVIVLIILLRKENKKIKNEEAEEEYNVYDNDENEFESNKGKQEEVETIVEETYETETKNEGRRPRRREKGRHSK